MKTNLKLKIKSFGMDYDSNPPTTTTTTTTTTTPSPNGPWVFTIALSLREVVKLHGRHFEVPLVAHLGAPRRRRPLWRRQVQRRVRERVGGDRGAALEAGVEQQAEPVAVGRGANLFQVDHTQRACWCWWKDTHTHTK